jgi:hypothetical protein
MSVGNNALRTDPDLWSINQSREQNGMRVIGPPKEYRRAFKRADMKFYQDYRSAGWNLPHNAKRKPKRVAVKPKRLAR